MVRDDFWLGQRGAYQLKRNRSKLFASCYLSLLLTLQAPFEKLEFRMTCRFVCLAVFTTIQTALQEHAARDSNMDRSFHGDRNTSPLFVPCLL